MFATIGLILKFLPMIGTVGALFSSVKKLFGGGKPQAPGDSCDAGQYHSTDGCDYPICNKPEHQHTKDLEAKKEALRKRKRWF